ncbi:MAG TPA: hypothetical protein VIL65_05325 [Beijerinckiaceae bacterium]|jgi:hypothetical protein
MRKTLMISLLGAVAAAAALGTAPAQAQFLSIGVGNGYTGAEYGYDDDEFGWGPAYRPETTFRPAYGFYPTERPYPYGGVTTTQRVVSTAPAYGDYGQVPVRTRTVTRSAYSYDQPITTGSIAGYPAEYGARASGYRQVAYYGRPRVVQRRVVTRYPAYGSRRVVSRRVITRGPYGERRVVVQRRAISY